METGFPGHTNGNESITPRCQFISAAAVDRPRQSAM
jgi:hypothetical protein